MGSQDELLRAPAALSTDSISAGFHSQKFGELFFLALESWAGGPGVGLGLLVPEINLPKFYPHRYGASLVCICTSPTSLDGCGFFNPIVVRLPFTLIADVPE